MKIARIPWGLFCAGIVFLLHAWLYATFYVDDAYISLRYVRQWLAGNGLVYNIGERVEGYSNFLWIVLLGLLGRFGVDLVVASRIWGIGFSLATLVLVYLFVRRLPYTFLSPLLLALSVPFAAWSVGGLEGPLYMFLVFAGSVQFYREEERGRGWTSSIFWGLTALTRPDGLLFGGIAFLYRVVRLYRLRRWPQPHDYVRGLVLIGIVGAHVGWRLAYYGYPLPNTIYAKSMGLSLRALLEGSYYTFQNFSIMGGFFFYGFMMLLALAARQKYRFVVYFTINTVAYMLFILYAGGDWMPGQRFLTAVLPLLVVVVHVGVVELTLLLSRSLKPTWVWAAIAGQLFYVALVAVTVRYIGPGIPPNHDLTKPYAWVEFLQEQVRETDTIAVFDAGFVAYKLPITVRIVDMVGLADEHIAHQPPQFPNGLLGRGDAWGRWDVAYVLAQNPRFIQVPVSGRDEAGNWQTGFTGTTLLANDPQFRSRYHQTDMRNIFQLNSTTDAR